MTYATPFITLIWDFNENIYYIIFQFVVNCSRIMMIVALIVKFANTANCDRIWNCKHCLRRTACTEPPANLSTNLRRWLHPWYSISSYFVCCLYFLFVFVDVKKWNDGDRLKRILVQVRGRSEPCSRGKRPFEVGRNNWQARRFVYVPTRPQGR